MFLTDVPVATVALCQHVLDTYASETNKTASVFRAFDDSDLNWRPHAKSMTVSELMKHQLMSERRFFSEFLGHDEPVAAKVLPDTPGVEAFTSRLVDLAKPRLRSLAGQSARWWLGRVRFFDVERTRVWIVSRRILHSAHHRAQLTVYLRLLGKPVVSVYGPTADVTWSGATPTLPDP